MDTQFVRDRITQLRLKKGVSEYQMSYDLGHSRSYVYNISSGKSLPPMAEFLQICKQRFTRGYKRYKETSGLMEWKIGHIFHSIFT